MPWWFRSRGGMFYLTAATAQVFLCVTVPELKLFFPTLTTSAALREVPFAGVFPVFSTAVWLYGIDRSRSPGEFLARRARAVAYCDVLLLVTVLVPLSAAFTVSGEQACLLSLRNTLGIVGMVLGCTVLVGPIGAIIASVGYLIASILFTPPEGQLLWGWPLAAIDNTAPWYLAGTLCIAGTVLYLIAPRAWRRRLPSR